MNQAATEGLGNLPNPSENFGTVPNASESFRNVRKLSERTDNHTLTVREIARLFDDAAVPRTERTIINWCRMNRQGVARLDAFFDENDRRYYVTAESVTRAIEEEKARLSAMNPAFSEPDLPQHSERKVRQSSPEGDGLEEANREIRDLEITTRAKDHYIERLESERNRFVDQLVEMSRYVGELESQVLQLGGAPRGDRSLPRNSGPTEGASNATQA